MTEDNVEELEEDGAWGWVQGSVIQERQGQGDCPLVLSAA